MTEQSINNDFEKASFVSRLFLCFVTRVIKLGKKKALELDDLPSLPENDGCKYLTRELEKFLTESSDIS